MDLGGCAKLGAQACALYQPAWCLLGLVPGDDLMCLPPRLQKPRHHQCGNLDDFVHSPLQTVVESHALTGLMALFFFRRLFARLCSALRSSCCVSEFGASGSTWFGALEMVQ